MIRFLPDFTSTNPQDTQNLFYSIFIKRYRRQRERTHNLITNVCFSPKNSRFTLRESNITGQFKGDSYILTSLVTIYVHILYLSQKLKFQEDFPCECLLNIIKIQTSRSEFKEININYLMDQYHYLFKYIIVGDTSVGKSCLLLNYTEKKFIEEHDTTIGVEFGSQLLKLEDKTIKVQIWDTAGQESFRSITRSYYKGSIGVVLVFDLTKRDTFYNVVKWHNEILDCTHEFVEITLVGNKLDLENERQVPTAEAQDFANQHKMSYVETSAKTGEGVDRVFEEMAGRILQKINKKLIDYTQEIYGIKLGPFFNTPKEEQQPTQLQNQKPKQQNDGGCC